MASRLKRDDDPDDHAEQRAEGDGACRCGRGGGHGRSRRIAERQVALGKTGRSVLQRVGHRDELAGCLRDQHARPIRGGVGCGHGQDRGLRVDTCAELIGQFVDRGAQPQAGAHRLDELFTGSQDCVGVESGDGRCQVLRRLHVVQGRRRLVGRWAGDGQPSGARKSQQRGDHQPRPTPAHGSGVLGQVHGGVRVPLLTGSCRAPRRPPHHPGRTVWRLPAHHRDADDRPRGQGFGRTAGRGSGSAPRGQVGG